jgi:23S rRNA (cytidine1920-2'-O)/16S rRNA (cytidine1409-2'-O)-methyltransferase
MKQRLDQVMVLQGLVPTRSQAESYIKLGEVKVNGSVISKPGYLVDAEQKIVLGIKEQYVSRAALKLGSVAEALRLEFKGRTMLDVGSSTGGFTEYALKHGASQVIAVEIGTNQMHPSLRNDPRIELHEKTDIRDFVTNQPIDLVVADVSFISLREILPSIAKLVLPQTDIVVMVKPQFEAAASNLKHKGVIKNDRLRRDILKSFEEWAKGRFFIVDKADSLVAGAKGNQERFYHLRKLAG